MAMLNNQRVIQTWLLSSASIIQRWTVSIQKTLCTSVTAPNGYFVQQSPAYSAKFRQCDKTESRNRTKPLTEWYPQLCPECFSCPFLTKLSGKWQASQSSWRPVVLLGVLCPCISGKLRHDDPTGAMKNNPKYLILLCWLVFFDITIMGYSNRENLILSVVFIQKSLRSLPVPSPCRHPMAWPSFSKVPGQELVKLLHLRSDDCAMFHGL